MTDLYVKRVAQQDRRLGRQVVHDERSRRFARRLTVDTATWRTRSLRTYDPTPNPDQPVGCCTGVDNVVKQNTVGNRVKGRVLGMADALRVYSRATQLDPWEGSWEPDDTGSSGLAAAKASREFGIGGAYEWLFGGVDEVVQSIVDGHPVGVGTWWTWDMFDPDSAGVVHPTGGSAGGHQWTARRYDELRDLVGGRCWWGSFRDFWIPRTELADLLADDGDAHIQAGVEAA